MSAPITVVIPAKDEASSIGGTLEALALQTTEHGAPLDPAAFDVSVLCNNCRDGTAAAVRAFAARRPWMRVRVVEIDLPAGDAHVGNARRFALDLAADAGLAAHGPRTVLASTDADTLVSPTWISSITREIEGVDAVAGFVCIGDADRDAMFAPLRLLYDRELIYRRLIGVVEARFDPRPFDSSPRHAAFVGANFAVTAGAYRRAGGLPPLMRLEDHAFARALDLIDARVKHSYDVRATTSARFAARVDGGFGALLRELRDLGASHGRYVVRAGRAIVDEARTRAAARVYWGAVRRGERPEPEASWFAGTRGDLAAAAKAARSFGVFWSVVGTDAVGDALPGEPIEDAIESLRRAVTECDYPSAQTSDASNPFRPTRRSVASGAG